jgi:hypothetical protein
MAIAKSRTPAIIKKYNADPQTEWMRDLAKRLNGDRRISESELSTQTREFLGLLQTACTDGIESIESEAWAPILEFLEDVSRFGAGAVRTEYPAGAGQ